MKPDKILTQHLDANETAHFEEQLKYVKTETYDRLYPEYGLFAGGYFPISYEVPDTATSIEVRSFDRTGIASIITDYSDDLPRADIMGVADTVPIRPLGSSYGYSVDEVRISSKTGSRLDARKAEAAKQSIFARMNDIMFKARPETHAKMTGILYTAGIPVTVLPNNAAGTSKKWADKTADEMLADLKTMSQASWKLTNGVERPDTILLPLEAYGECSTRPRSTQSDTTVLEFFLKTSPYITRVGTIAELDSVTPRPSQVAGSSSVALVYKNDKSKFAFEITKQFEQFPAQERGLEFVVPCLAKTAGPVVYYPLSITIWEGL